MHYRSPEEEQEDWKVQHFEARRHQHPKKTIPFVELPSFNGASDPNIYLGWEAKVEQIFNVYEVEEEQKVKLDFQEYAMQWWHQLVMDIDLNKWPVVVSWNALKEGMLAHFVSSL